MRQKQQITDVMASKGDPDNKMSKNLKTDIDPANNVMFMSQFLDCFSDKEIVSILKKCHEALPANGRIFINETFWDCQRFEASAFRLQMLPCHRC